MNKIIELEPLFAADSDGNRYKIHVYQEKLIGKSLSGQNSSIDGLLSYRLSDGSALNQLSATEFEIIKNSTKITRL